VLLHLTTLRDRRTDAVTFRRVVGRVIMCVFPCGDWQDAFWRPAFALILEN
jgi:hypothetical protein